MKHSKCSLVKLYLIQTTDNTNIHFKKLKCKILIKFSKKYFQFTDIVSKKTNVFFLLKMINNKCQIIHLSILMIIIVNTLAHIGAIPIKLLIAQ